MAGLNKYYKENRTIYVADSFEGLPPPDKKYKGDEHHKIKCLAVGLDEVKDNFKRYGLLDENVKFIKGYFEHSLKNTDITRFASGINARRRYTTPSCNATELLTVKNCSFSFTKTTSSTGVVVSSCSCSSPSSNSVLFTNSNTFFRCPSFIKFLNRNIY